VKFHKTGFSQRTLKVREMLLRSFITESSFAVVFDVCHFQQACTGLESPNLGSHKTTSDCVSCSLWHVHQFFFIILTVLF